MLLETSACPLEVLAMQSVYEYIMKVKDMPNHILLEQAQNIIHKVPNLHRSKTLSSSRVLDIIKRLKRWGVEDLLEISSDVMKYVIIEDRLAKVLMTKWQDDTMSNL